MMKLYFFFGMLLLLSKESLAQDFRGENKIFIKLEMLDGSFLHYESSKLSIDMNEEQNTFDLAVDMQSFNPLNENANMDDWNGIFHEEYHSEWSYKGSFPNMKIDAQSDNKQTIEISGSMYLGDLKMVSPLKIEWIQMDRFVFIDFKTQILFSALGLELPENYRERLSGVMYIEVLNAKLMAGFR